MATQLGRIEMAALSFIRIFAPLAKEPRRWRTTASPPLSAPIHIDVVDPSTAPRRGRADFARRMPPWSPRPAEIRGSVEMASLSHGGWITSSRARLASIGLPSLPEQARCMTTSRHARSNVTPIERHLLGATRRTDLANGARRELPYLLHRRHMKVGIHRTFKDSSCRSRACDHGHPHLRQPQSLPGRLRLRWTLDVDSIRLEPPSKWVTPGASSSTSAVHSTHLTIGCDDVGPHPYQR